jgi:hypothetical protein
VRVVGFAVAERERALGLEKVLKGMFRALKNRPVPDKIGSVVDQLDEGSPAEGAKRKRS